MVWSGRDGGRREVSSGVESGRDGGRREVSSGVESGRDGGRREVSSGVESGREVSSDVKWAVAIGCDVSTHIDTHTAKREREGEQREGRGREEKGEGGRKEWRSMTD